MSPEPTLRTEGQWMSRLALALSEIAARERKDVGLYRCEECGEPGTWQLTRRGDVATVWACSPHLAVVAVGMQRPSEETELVVTFMWEVR